MTEPKGKRAEVDKSSLEVDLYGIKVRARPARSKEQRPKTWKEVGKRVNQALMTISAGLFDVLAETVEGLKRVIRGTTSVPEEILERARAARRRVEQREAGHQEVLQVDLGGTPYDREEALKRLAGKLNELRSRGCAAGVKVDERGIIIVYAVKPEERDVIRESVRKVLPPAPNEDPNKE